MNEMTGSIKNDKSLLGLLDDKARQKVLAFCQQKEYEKDDQIVREMDEDHNVYFIDKGSVRVTLFSSTGKEVSFVELGEGGNFGELSALDGYPRSANVIALEKTMMTIMSPDSFAQLLKQYPDIALQLLRQLTAMVRRLCDRIFEYSTLGVNNRIHAELLRLARRNLDLDGVARIKNMPTHAQFASRLSCTREAVSRELRDLEKMGVLQRDKKKFIIEDIEKLQRIVDNGPL